MADTVWARFRRHRWLPQMSVVVLLVAGVVWYGFHRVQEREESNASLLSRACAGQLPRSLGEVVPDDARWQVAEDSVPVARAGYGARELMTCVIKWDAGRKATGRLSVVAVPLPEAPLRGVRIGELTGRATEEPPEWLEKSPEFATRTTTVACPSGLPGLPQPATRFRVSGRLDVDGSRADAALTQTLAAVANHVRRAADCTGSAVRAADVREIPQDDDDQDGSDKDGAKTRPSCAWFAPAALGLGKPAGWPGTDGSYDGLPWAEACRLEATTQDGGKPNVVTSGRWWGEALAEARVEYGAELAALGNAAPSGKRRNYELALWAESVCEGRKVLQRVSAVSTAEDGLPEWVDRLGDRYLPTAGCRDTKVLGKVWL
ncbi:hypothetical protein ABZ729_26270 [Streptomyces sp. NPDC006678]|uniref:hypothetical protein n=1 Tax=Streptomyces sp. NPDC006678 TaxID=3157185 RepID=UPI00340348EC